MADTKGAVEGEGFIRETYTFVRWEWLTLLAAQVGLAVVFVIAIIIHTARIGVDVVKSSNTAELFALQGDNGPRGTNIMASTQSMGIKTKLAKESTGMLLNTGGEWKLKL